MKSKIPDTKGENKPPWKIIVTSTRRSAAKLEPLKNRKRKE
jgi:hypothetical protein